MFVQYIFICFSGSKIYLDVVGGEPSRSYMLESKLDIFMFKPKLKIYISMVVNGELSRSALAY